MSPVLWLLLLLLDSPPTTSPAASTPKPTSPQPTTATAPASSAPVQTAPAPTAPMGSVPQPTGMVWPPPTRPLETQPTPAAAGAPATSAPAGAIKPPKRSLEYGEILVPALWLIGALMFAALIFSWLKRSRHQPETSPEALAHEQLAQFRKLRDEGEMTDEEYKKVMKKLQSRIQGGNGPPAAAKPLPGPAAKPPEAGQ